MRRGIVAMACWLVVVLAACGAPDDPGVTQPTSTPVAGPIDETQDLDCVRLRYPCSLGETPPELVERTAALIAAAGQHLVDGSMADALAFLSAEPDVVDVLSSDTAVTFRVEGAPPAWLLDHSDVGEGQAAAYRTAGSDPEPRVQLASVVGEDTTGDSQIDQRDAKRALVLAPYMWQFAPWDESDLVAERLGSMPGHEGNVRIRANRTRLAQDVTVADWLSLSEFDSIWISTHGARACGTLADGTQQCNTQLSTGIRFAWEDAQMSNSLARGFIPIGIYRDGQSSPDFELGVDAGFFRMHYPDGLDDAFLMLSACETGSVAGDQLAAAIGGDDFVMMAWSEMVLARDAFNASGMVLEQFSLGLSSEQAYEAVVAADLASAPNGRGQTTTLELIVIGADEVRLVELPTLLEDGEPLRDGAEIRVAGTPGDDEPDEIELDLRLIGIHDRAGYRVRYEIDGRPTNGSHNLSSATEGDLPYSYLVTHDVDVGFDLPTDDTTLAVIVDLPEGGESRYEIAVRFGGAVAVITIGGQTWEFELALGLVGLGLADVYGDCIVYDGNTGIDAAGFVGGDFDGVSFGANLRVGGGALVVRDPSADQKWIALGDRAHVTVLHLVPLGHSQIDEIYFDDGHAWGTATFIEDGEVWRWARANGPPPVPVAGTFDIQCG